MGECLSDSQKTWLGLGCCGCTCVWGLIILITVLANIRVLGPEEQYVVNTAKDKATIDGPQTTVLHPFRGKKDRKAIRLEQREYAVVKETKTGELRHEEIHGLLWLGAWDELVAVRKKIVLQRQQYVRLIDDITGYERVVSGPTTLVPGPYEYSPNGTELAVVIGGGKTVLTFNRTKGTERLITQSGVFVPGPYELILAVRMPIAVGPDQYAVVTNERTGEVRHEEGEMQLTVGAYERFDSIEKKVLLTKDEYIRLVDKKTGEERVVVGPTRFTPSPAEVSDKGVERAVNVGAQTSIVVLDHVTGNRSLIRREGIYTPGPYQEILEVRNSTLVGPEQYAVMKSLQNGSLTHLSGPLQLFVSEYEEFVGLATKVVLQNNEFRIMVDKETGEERVLQGPLTFEPTPTEFSSNGTQVAQFIDQDTALVVLNRTSGQKRLVTTRGRFTPAPYEVITETRTIIRVLPHEAVVVRTGTGQLIVYSGSTGGSGSGTSFFLGPYEAIFEMMWSDYAALPGGNKMRITRIDMREKKIFFKYTVRTSDNVELRLTGTIFYKVADVDKMISMTADPEGDVWMKSRSALIQAVSQVDLAHFRNNFQNLINSAFAAQRAGGFYGDRGLMIQSMELTDFEIVDPDTAAILQQIIEEGTNRINLLQVQDSANEVARAALQAQILLEQQTKDLILEQKTNFELKAQTQGEASGLERLAQVQAFIDSLDDGVVPDVDTRVRLYEEHEKLKSMNLDTEHFAKMHLYLTPDNLTLRLNTGTQASVPAAGDTEL